MNTLENLDVPPEALVVLGAPSQAFEEPKLNAIRLTVSKIDGIVEAHIPQCFVPDIMSSPEQILFAVTRSRADIEAVKAEIFSGLRDMHEISNLTIWVTSVDNPFLVDARQADSRLL